MVHFIVKNLNDITMNAKQKDFKSDYFETCFESNGSPMVTTVSILQCFQID